MHDEISTGARVGAFLSADEKSIHLLGYGVYEGDVAVDPGARGPFAEAARVAGMPNPSILLDSGDRVWGCECWWSSEATVASLCREREVGRASLADARREYDRRCAEEGGDGAGTEDDAGAAAAPTEER
jgi:hypothetical protein